MLQAKALFIASTIIMPLLLAMIRSNSTINNNIAAVTTRTTTTTARRALSLVFFPCASAWDVSRFSTSSLSSSSSRRGRPATSHHHQDHKDGFLITTPPITTPWINHWNHHRNHHHHQHHRYRHSSSLVSMAARRRGPGDDDDDDDDQGGTGRPAKFLTFDDLDNNNNTFDDDPSNNRMSPGALMLGAGMMDEYENDVEGMAANYNPQDWEDDDDDDADAQRYDGGDDGDTRSLGSRMMMGFDQDPMDRSSPRRTTSSSSTTTTTTTSRKSSTQPTPQSPPPPMSYSKTSLPAPAPASLPDSSSSSSSSPPKVTPKPSFQQQQQQQQRKNKRKEEQEEEEIAEPRSPLSFLSIIADPDPDPVDDINNGSTSRTVQDDGYSWKRSAPISRRPSRRMEEDNGTSTTTSSSSNNKNNIQNQRGDNGDAAAADDDDDDSNLSAEAFRAKYSFQEQEINFPSMLVDDETKRSGAAAAAAAAVPMVESSRRLDTLYQLETDLQRIEKEIVTANNGRSFNLASYKQVSMVLFGNPDESTSKSVLEGMAMSNILAKLILQHRQTKQLYSRLSKQEERSQQKTLKQQKQQQQQQQERSSMSSSSSPSSSSSSAGEISSQYQDHDNEPLMLVDTSSFIFRAYYSMPPMHRADGMPTSAVLGFCNMLNRMVMSQLLAGKQPRLVLCCDAPSPLSGGPKTMRHDMYSQYKAHRQEAPMDLIPQFPFFRKAAQAYGMLWVEAPGYEADDVIASISHKALQEGLTVHIYSGDKDLMQLVTNSTTTASSLHGGRAGGVVEMIDPMTTTHWDHDSVMEKWGVPAHQLGDVLALAGDTADNIPGVPGIGPKIAAQLMQEFGSLEGLLDNLDQVKQAKRREKLEMYRDQAILSQALVRLERGLDWEAMLIDSPSSSSEEEFAAPPDRVADLRMQVMNPDRILRFYDEMGFVTIKQRLMDRLKSTARTNNNLPYTYYDTNTASPPRGGSGGGKSNSGFRPKRAEVPKPEDYDSVPF